MKETTRLSTAVNRPVDCDVEKRIIRQAVISTTGLAADGMILLPEGILLERYLKNPIVTRMHLALLSDVPEEPVVIGAVVSLVPAPLELVAEIQFADTEQGRDYAVLYGCNATRQACMRGWSVEGAILETISANWKQAQTISGQYWDAVLSERLQKKLTSIKIIRRFELSVLSAEALGADRNALTRAAKVGVAVAGELLTRIDLHAATMEVAQLKTRMSETDAKVLQLEKDITALRGEQAAGAAQSNAAALLEELRDLARTFH
jgi:outer membrane murein-binding lipoprotein Lpp